jgi:hypothetical protein
MGVGSQLPANGGIVRRPQIDSVPKPHIHINHALQTPVASG